MANTLPGDLLNALKESPGNASLQVIAADAAISAGDAIVLGAVIDLCGGSPFSDAARLHDALRLLSNAGDHVRVLLLAPAESATALSAKARKLLSEGMRQEAKAAYEQAVRLDPLLEDQAFAAELEGKIVNLSSARPRQAAGISNDDTKDDDVIHLLRAPGERTVFADVGGLEDVKREIRRRIITPFLKPSLFQRFKRNAGGGILLYGPPGCGKTLLARATAGECGARFYNVAITDVLDMYIGESERKLHAIFENARQASPAVLFFDEIEAIGGKRQHSREATSAKLVSQFLTELDGFAQENKGLLILGATNVPWAVDPAFRRPGRFDRVLFVPPPDAEARRLILRSLLDQRPCAEDIDIEVLVRATSGYSGADLRAVVDSASDEAIEASIDSGREQQISMPHLRSAAASARPTTLEWLTSARNHARYSNQAGQYDEVLAFLNKR